jgi:hypothetical protein
MLNCDWTNYRVLTTGPSASDEISAPHSFLNCKLKSQVAPEPQQRDEAAEEQF